LPDDIPPQLKKACQTVLRKGWTGVRFPKNFTPLHLAAKLGSTEAVDLLLDAGVCDGLRLEDDFGMKPVDYAIKAGHKKIAKVLDPSAKPVQ
jgi:hypothetical protein